MRKKLISVLLVSTLLVGCVSTKPTTEECCKNETAIEKVVSKDPIMKLLATSLIIYAIQLLVTK
jgi:PBP1b-binding outer membrane lipoprotein LpoB